MPKQHNYYIYIMTNRTNSVFYTGVTGDLVRRAYEHRNSLIEGFTTKYHVTKLVYYEQFDEIVQAILREKQIKAGSRAKKLDLIQQFNNEFADLYDLII